VVSRDFQGGSGLKAIMKTWHGFLRLSGFERGIALEAMAGLAATWLGLRLAGFRRWKKALEWLAPRANSEVSPSDASLDESARVIARMEAATARNLFFATNCLEQSLVLWWLLRLRGIDAELRIGARKDSGRFEAHSWVEFDGRVLNDAGEEHLHFVPFEGPIVSMETQTR
jgi:hypothetical protein